MSNFLLTQWSNKKPSFGNYCKNGSCAKCFKTVFGEKFRKFISPKKSNPLKRLMNGFIGIFCDETLFHQIWPVFPSKSFIALTTNCENPQNSTFPTCPIFSGWWKFFNNVLGLGGGDSKKTRLAENSNHAWSSFFLKFFLNKFSLATMSVRETQQHAKAIFNLGKKTSVLETSW